MKDGISKSSNLSWRRRRRPPVGLTAAATTLVLTAAAAFQVSLPEYRLVRQTSHFARTTSYPLKRQVVTDPLLLDTLPSIKQTRNAAEIERLYKMSADNEQYYPHSELLRVIQSNKDEMNGMNQNSTAPIQFKGLSTTAHKRPKEKLKRLVSDKRLKAKKAPSRSSTMPGFAALSDKQRAFQDGIRLAEKSSGKKFVDTPEAKRKRRQKRGDAMYRESASVPESMIQLAHEIHGEERITRQQEIELGEKTQEAIRLQNLYDVLKAQLDREPTDEEWCAAAGKINMEAIRQAIQEGLESKNKLVTSNLRMVQSVVNTYIRNGLSGQYNAGDLMQEGMLALIRAAEKFEPDRGWKFSTYAMYWVRASVKQSQIVQSRSVTIPQRLHENYKRILRVESELTATLGRKPTPTEIGEMIGMSELQVNRCVTAMEQRYFSLDQSVSNVKKPMDINNRDTLVELIDSYSGDGESERMERELLRQDLVETLHRYLDEEEVEILLLRYGLKASPEHQKLNQQLTIAELSRTVGLKPDRVRRIIQNSLDQLKDAPEDWLDFQRAVQ